MWTGGFGSGGQFKQVSSSLLRGGPSIYIPNSTRFFSYFSSDERKALSLTAITSQSFGKNNSSRREFYKFAFTLRPTNNLKIHLEPEYSKTFTELSSPQQLQSPFLQNILPKTTDGVFLESSPDCCHLQRKSHDTGAVQI